MHLKFDLYDVYNNLLIKRGREITEAVIDELVKKGETLPKKLIMAKDTALLNDIEHVFSDDRYARIFNTSSLRQTIIDALNRLKLEEPLVAELSNMKELQPYTYRHVQIIAAMTITLISILGKSQYNPVLAAHLSFTHDIGKTRIPEDVLNKKLPLTHNEYELIRSHPAIGYLLLNYYCGWEGKKYCWTAYEHHEKLDGSGYPRGIKKIDPYAQLIAPLDIFDALISDRPYRRTPFTTRLAVDFLLDAVDKEQLNREHVYTLVNCLRKHKICPVRTIRVSKEKRDRPPLGSVYGMRTADTWLKKD